MIFVFFGVSSKPPTMAQTYALPRYNDEVTGSRFNTSDLESIHPAIPSPHPTKWDGDPSDTDHFVANRNSLSVIYKTQYTVYSVRYSTQYTAHSTQYTVYSPQYTI
jgi:hypothetical protein